MPGRVTPENEGIVKDSQPSYEEGVGRTERDDEEEWGGIPIPQSDDSEDEYWLDESSDDEPEQHEADTEPSIFNPRKPDDDSDDASSTLTCLAQQPTVSPASTEQKNMSFQNIDDYAFLIGPRLDGLIQQKDGTILTLQEPTTILNLSHQSVSPSLEMTTLNAPYTVRFTGLPSWTGHLMRFQRSILKMSYKCKSKMRSKLMKCIRKAVPIQELLEWYPNKSRHIDVCSWRAYRTAASHALSSLRFDPYTAFIPESTAASHQRGPLRQCMNAIRSPNRPKSKLKKKRTSHKRKRYFSPITIPGTPTERHTPNDDEASRTLSQTEETDLNLYYRIFNRYRPDIDESNAESADRLRIIETEYLRLRKQQGKQCPVTEPTTTSKPLASCIPDTNNETNGPSFGHHSLSPFQQISSSLTFKTSRKDSPIIEPMDLSNNVQDIILNSPHSLYNNPDQPLPPQVVDVLYDTGAAISMFPEEYTYA
jgi:hypothetical protein